MSSYVKWYKNEQDRFKAELATLSFKQIVSSQDHIRAKATRLGMLTYCIEHGFLNNNYNDVSVIEFPTESKNIGWWSRIIDWFKKEILRYA